MILVEANVTESPNKITLSGNSSVKFYENAVKLEFLASNPKTFKPGLPYTAYVSYHNISARPLKEYSDQTELKYLLLTMQSGSVIQCLFRLTNTIILLHGCPSCSKYFLAVLFRRQTFQVENDTISLKYGASKPYCIQSALLHTSLPIHIM